MEFRSDYERLAHYEAKMKYYGAKIGAEELEGGNVINEYNAAIDVLDKVIADSTNNSKDAIAGLNVARTHLNNLLTASKAVVDTRNFLSSTASATGAVASGAVSRLGNAIGNVFKTTPAPSPAPTPAARTPAARTSAPVPASNTPTSKTPARTPAQKPASNTLARIPSPNTPAQTPVPVPLVTNTGQSGLNPASRAKQPYHYY